MNASVAVNSAQSTNELLASKCGWETVAGRLHFDLIDIWCFSCCVHSFTDKEVRMCGSWIVSAKVCERTPPTRMAMAIMWFSISRSLTAQTDKYYWIFSDKSNGKNQCTQTHADWFAEASWQSKLWAAFAIFGFLCLCVFGCTIESYVSLLTSTLIASRKPHMAEQNTFSSPPRRFAICSHSKSISKQLIRLCIKWNNNLLRAQSIDSILLVSISETARHTRY